MLSIAEFSLTVPLFSVAFLAVLGATYLCLYWVRSHLSHQSLPPGPPTWPLIGNILQFSPKDAHLAFARYKETYGDVAMIHGLGNHILVLNSMSVIDDLLVKGGNVFSYRPKLVFAGELMNLDKSTALLQYGTEWRTRRRLTHTSLSITGVRQFHQVQESLAVQLCLELAGDPESFFEHISLFASRVVLSVVYGIDVPDRHDELIRQIEDTMRFVSQVTVPGAFLCDILPFLKHLPSWVPFQRKAACGKDMVELSISTPFQRVREDMATGKAEPSLTRDLLSGEQAQSEEYISDVKWIAGSLYGPASETTVVAILVSIIGMLLNPDAQRRAQAEIDKMIGSARVPTMADKDDLPYVDALIKEALRYRPVLPLGLARRAEGESLYSGYVIPHDTIILPNVWAISRAPNSKYDPESFIPERFLDPTQNVVDPLNYNFGFGRRVCPGKTLAHNSLFVAIATILWTFNITLRPGTSFKPKFSPDLISSPRSFLCNITPRSPERVGLLRKIMLSQSFNLKTPM